ncbi:MAG: YihY/virulence factor BrkB family protein [Deltaproteobacteria bacterium HGW-Deltaproteobacteria-5]|nr:MAG: YihY/virulence factor BrkB family protein [Deltaproteobacteria bacterium HGW-Deltaproteobacteria-5]
MTGIGQKHQRAVNFIKQDVWRIQRNRLSPVKSFFLNLLRVVILSVRGFDEDKCQLRASALTFYSLISIVPILAMAFGVAKGFGFEKILEKQLREKLAGHEDILANVIQFSHSLLENTQGGLMAGVGVIMLFWAVLKVLGQVEDSFNDIWGVKKHRPLGRKFADYLSLMLICPVILIISGGVTVFVSTQVAMIMEKFTVLGSFRPVVFFLLALFPYTLMWGLFTFLYVFMPGIITGTIFQVVQWFYITFQVGVVKYNAIYGSFAALPLFLAWLQLSWLIVLYGAELSFAHQNVDTYEFEPDALGASHRLRTLLALLITHHLIANFRAGDKALTVGEISNRLEIPIRFVNDILSELVESNILATAESEEGTDPAYQPALDPDRLTIQYVVEAMEKRGQNTMPFIHTPEFDALSASLESFGRTIDQMPENILLKKL